jgi:N-acetyl-anhydromuramyl-L-alanine amidase AmpD
MRKKRLLFYGTLLLVIVALVGVGLFRLIEYAIQQAHPLEMAFEQASNESHVPLALLKAVAYSETRFDMHGVQGSTAGPGAYGIMNVVSSKKTPDPMGRAAKALGVSTLKIKTDATTNIRAGAVLLKEYALQLSPKKTLPTSLNGWRGAVALYEGAQYSYVVNLYVTSVYKAIQNGFKVQTASGETVDLAPQPVNTQPLTNSELPALAKMPAGCTTQSDKDNQVDYPEAVNCILNPAQHDCDKVPGTNAPCNYFPDTRPEDFDISQVVIHDIEGNVARALSAFLNPGSTAASHYIVGSDGTVYQTIHDHDVAFHAANLWYNQHSIGIEHEGYATSGNVWYTSATYQASAKLTAYLAQKYNIPLEHDHIVGHGTVQAPTLAGVPNHVDPGQYWQWDYYLNQIHQQGVAYPQTPTNKHLISVHLPVNTPFNASNFFYLYNSPKLDANNLLPQVANSTDTTDETNTVEAATSYYYLDKKPDEHGFGIMMYQIWYGESVNARKNPSDQFMHARLAWLAVPEGLASDGQGIAVKLHSTDGKPIPISGSPKTNTATTDYHIGDAPDGAIFVSAYSVPEDNTNTQWFEINYNHRQAWVPDSAVEFMD